MKCPRCQQENRSGAKFGEECASPLAKDLLERRYLRRPLRPDDIYYRTTLNT